MNSKLITIILALILATASIAYFSVITDDTVEELAGKDQEVRELQKQVEELTETIETQEPEIIEKVVTIEHEPVVEYVHVPVEVPVVEEVEELTLSGVRAIPSQYQTEIKFSTSIHAEATVTVWSADSSNTLESSGTNHSVTFEAQPDQTYSYIVEVLSLDLQEDATSEMQFTTLSDNTAPSIVDHRVSRKPGFAQFLLGVSASEPVRVETTYRFTFIKDDDLRVDQTVTSSGYTTNSTAEIPSPTGTNDNTMLIYSFKLTDKAGNVFESEEMEQKVKFIQ